MVYSTFHPAPLSLITITKKPFIDRSNATYIEPTKNKKVKMTKKQKSRIFNTL